MKWKIFVTLSALGCALAGCQAPKNISSSHPQQTTSIEYTFPKENEQHEGTWLIWPHSYTYGKKYQQDLEPIWIQMTQALAPGEKVHIVAYNEKEKAHIARLLKKHHIPMKQITFTIAKSDDVWVRDVGPIFVYDKHKRLHILNFKFNGWGNKERYHNDDQLAAVISRSISVPLVNVPHFVLEGGAVELDGDGSLMATESAILNKNRNPHMTQKEADNEFKKYFGATNDIWLKGVKGQDITDDHIDGFARFYNNRTILTVPKGDFFELYEHNPASDYQKLENARNAQGQHYKLETIPLTKHNVKGLDYKGSYLNYYIGNKVLLLPVYGDNNDEVAIQKMKKLYPNKEIVPINVVKLYKNGGMIHCVTQQQPYDHEKNNH